MKGKNSEDKGKSRSTSLIVTMTGGSQIRGISFINTLQTQNSPTRARPKSQLA